MWHYLYVCTSTAIQFRGNADHQMKVMEYKWAGCDEERQQRGSESLSSAERV